MPKLSVVDHEADLSSFINKGGAQATVATSSEETSGSEESSLLGKLLSGAETKGSISGESSQGWRGCVLGTTSLSE